MADEITLCAIAFFLHHELSHTYLDQVRSQSSLNHERDCDEAAAKWCLGAVGVQQLVVQKRALGVAVGLLVIAARGIHTGEHDGVEHPLDFDRLLDTLVAFVPPEQESVWGAVVAVLAIHTSAIGRSPPPGEFVGSTAFRDAAVAYREQLREHLRTRVTSTEQPQRTQETSAAWSSDCGDRGY